TGYRGKIAVRIPGKSFALDLAKAADFPITATSANISGTPPAQEAAEVIGHFGENIDLIVDGNKTPGGKPSTIIDVTVTPPKIIRDGRVQLESDHH
ncbi:MAG TPA: threonylcarbamoyl-AMP synthase, partial [Nitrospirae bacterium]|nr:threonylcarbamoyl-AMP synthase [Nitrospirota bacterium]